MSKIILPIKPKYSKEIFNGSKTFELRRSKPKKQIEHIVIYETSPTSKVVGEFEVKKIIEEKISKLWTKTKHSNSISKDDFNHYFKSLEIGYAYEINKVKRYQEPKNINHYGFSSPPQNFVYIK